MWLPKSFFGMRLKLGSLVVGVVMCVVTIICLVVTIIQVSKMMSEKSLENWSVKEFIGRNAYGITIVELVYCIFMLFVCIWFFWGVHLEKPNVVLSWLIITTMWLSEVCCFLFVLICIYSFDVSVISCIFSLVFGILTICVLAYGLLIVLAYWVELKKKRKESHSLKLSQMQHS